MTVAPGMASPAGAGIATGPGQISGITDPSVTIMVAAMTRAAIHWKKVFQFWKSSSLLLNPQNSPSSLAVEKVGGSVQLQTRKQNRL